MKKWVEGGSPPKLIANRGFKVAVDKLSLPADPDTMDREPSPPYRAQIRAFVGERFPDLKDAPVIETRVCQYENTETGNYLVDRHPEMENVWIVGGGSGHGFKNGPAMSEYVASVVARGAPLARSCSRWNTSRSLATWWTSERLTCCLSGRTLLR